MAIHHTQIKKAEKLGIMLSEVDSGTEGATNIEAFWPERNVRIYAKNVTEAMKKMTERQEQLKADEFDEDEESGDVNGEEEVEVAAILRSPTGVALDGGVAYREGTASADCPFNSEDSYDEFEQWNNAWDEAADEAEPEPAGSVVAQKYRAIYAEMGHPTHCGDWLAQLLNNLCITDKNGTDMERFKMIMEANGVNMSKYKTSGNGWQGRYRMTGRNLVARKVFETGKLLEPDSDGTIIAEYKAPKDWLDTRKYVKA